MTVAQAENSINCDSSSGLFERVQNLTSIVRDSLLKSMAKDHWEGELSSSALAVAVSIIALKKVDAEQHSKSIVLALQWLQHHANQDGGYGDTVDAPSNLSTSLLVWCAFAEEPSFSASENLETWITRQVGSLDAEAIASAILDHYGKDRTFSVPILMTCALCGRLGENPWKFVPQLPFELAALPQWLYRFVGMQVVSYALPALIAIGWGRFFHSHKKYCPLSWLRTLLAPRLFQTLQRIQPENGGYLEAVPLTAFVTMNLASSGHRDCEVVRKGVDFLVKSLRSDGGSPIDTHLATWLTSLSIQALGDDLPNKDQVERWLMTQQHQQVHPFTGAEPGGWAWTPLAGGVPDADDTSAALLAIRQLTGAIPNNECVEKGIEWLLNLQNRDGGMPTFCRGWGQLPFDRSCPDITANALNAFNEYHGYLPASMEKRVNGAIRKGLMYLEEQQRSDGSWLPLWFGNPWLPNHENPVYGTSKVLIALAELDATKYPACLKMIRGGLNWLLSARNADAGWGRNKDGHSSVEETTLVLEAMSKCVRIGEKVDFSFIADAVSFLETAWLAESKIKATPIGLYFASLWYSESLYPVIFSLQALKSVETLLVEGAESA